MAMHPFEAWLEQLGGGLRELRDDMNNADWDRFRQALGQALAQTEGATERQLLAAYYDLLDHCLSITALRRTMPMPNPTTMLVEPPNSNRAKPEAVSGIPTDAIRNRLKDLQGEADALSKPPQPEPPPAQPASAEGTKP